MTKQKQSAPKSALTNNDVQLSLARRPVSSAGFADIVRSLVQSWRQGTVACKGRSDVAFSNKKPWKQKGTGRARAGSRRSPLWRKGGVTFGPQKRTRQLSVPQNVRKGVFNTLFWQCFDAGRIVLLNDVVATEAPTTAAAVQALNKAGVGNAKVVVFLPADDHVQRLSFANLKLAAVSGFDQPNAYDLAAADYWVVFKRDLDAFKQMVEQWK